MSRVFDTPRYQKECAVKVLAHCAAGISLHDGGDVLVASKMNLPDEGWYKAAELMEIASSAEYAEPFIDRRNLEHEEYVGLYAAISRWSEKAISGMTRCIGLATIEMMRSVKVVYCDDDALVRLWVRACRCELELKKLNKDHIQLSTEFAETINICQIPYSGLTGKTSIDTLKSMTRSLRYTPEAWRFYDAARFADRLTTGFKGMKIRSAVRNLDDIIAVDGMEGLLKCFRAHSKKLGDIIVYDFVAYKCVIIDGEAHMFDKASLDVVTRCIRALHNVTLYSYLYRSTGESDRSYKAMPRVVSDYIKYISGEMYKYVNGAGRCDKFSKYMKGAFQLYINMIGKEHEKFAAEDEMRIIRLTEEVMENAQSSKLPWDAFSMASIHPRVCCDILSLYALIPPVAFEVKGYMERVEKVFNDPLHMKVKPEDFKWFEKYWHRCRVPEIIRELGDRSDEALIYTPDPSKKVQEALGAKYDAILSKYLRYIEEADDFEIKPFRSWVPFADNWHRSANSVTHVWSPSSTPIIIDGRSKLSIDNELDYALVYGNKLAGSYSPQDVRSKIRSGSLPCHRVSYESIKNEGAKLAEKGRGIHSADDITREMISEAENNRKISCKRVPGMVISKSDYYINKKIQKMGQDMVTGSNRVYMSQDVKSWSDELDYKVELLMEKLLLKEYVDSPGSVLECVYPGKSKGVTLVMDKRGYTGETLLKNGTFQGWCGVLDSAFHSRLIGLIIREAKLSKVISPSDKAEILTMIDDALVALNLDEDIRKEDVKIKIRTLFDRLCDVYKRFSCTIDVLKSLVSTIKFQFLNITMYAGSEIPLSFKVIAKADRTWSMLIPSMADISQSIMGSYIGAVKRGGDPYVLYYLALLRIHDAILSHSSGSVPYGASTMSLWAFAPVSHGGLGIPIITNWVAPVSHDPLSEYIANVRELIRVCSMSPSGKQTAESMSIAMCKYLSSLECKGQSSLSNYSMLSVKGMETSSGIRDAFVKGYLANKAVDADMKRILSSSVRVALDNLIDAMMTTCHVDATILSLFIDSLPQSLAEEKTKKFINAPSLWKTIPLKTIINLARRCRQVDKTNMLWWKNLSHFFQRKEYEMVSSLLESGACGSTIAATVRNNAFMRKGYSVINHTGPATLEVFAHVEPPANPEAHGFLEVTFGSLRDSIDGRKRSMYDCRNNDKQFYGYKTSGSRKLIPDKYASLPKCDTSIYVCRSIIEYCLSNDYPCEALIAIATIAFQRNIMEVELACDAREYVGVSSKRLPGLLNKDEMMINCFKSCQGIVQMGKGGLGQVLDTAHTRHNYLSHLLSLRARLLIDSAINISRVGTLHPTLYYGVSYGSIVPESPDKPFFEYTADVERCLDRYAKSMFLPFNISSRQTDIAYIRLPEYGHGPQLSSLMSKMVEEAMLAKGNSTVEVAIPKVLIRELVDADILDADYREATSYAALMHSISSRKHVNMSTAASIILKGIIRGIISENEPCGINAASAQSLGRMANFKEKVDSDAQSTQSFAVKIDYAADHVNRKAKQVCVIRGGKNALLSSVAYAKVPSVWDEYVENPHVDYPQIVRDDLHMFVASIMQKVYGNIERTSQLRAAALQGVESLTSAWNTLSPIYFKRSKAARASADYVSSFIYDFRGSLFQAMAYSSSNIMSIDFLRTSIKKSTEFALNRVIMNMVGNRSKVSLDEEVDIKFGRGLHRITADKLWREMMSKYPRSVSDQERSSMKARWELTITMTEDDISCLSYPFNTALHYSGMGTAFSSAYNSSRGYVSYIDEFSTPKNVIPKPEANRVDIRGHSLEMFQKYGVHTDRSELEVKFYVKAFDWYESFNEQQREFLCRKCGHDNVTPFKSRCTFFDELCDLYSQLSISYPDAQSLSSLLEAGITPDMDPKQESSAVLASAISQIASQASAAQSDVVAEVFLSPLEKWNMMDDDSKQALFERCLDDGVICTEFEDLTDENIEEMMYARSEWEKQDTGDV